MPGLIPQAFIDELIARADIVEIIGSRLQLKKSGREYKACCPFHDEKTPSFWVSPEKQFYHCFGCGAHGTAMRFLMEHDKLSFPEAVEDIAGRLGLDVPHESMPAHEAGRRKDATAFDLMSDVAKFYSGNLGHDARAREYLEHRGLDAETIERFAIGYAPGSWNEIAKRFGESPDKVRQLAENGLIIERERGESRDGTRHYDRFRDRIMFPIRDARGRVIAFGGRIIGQGEPKYLNSPETPLFYKGRELYGLYEARRTKGELRRLLIVEGYMDVVRLHQYGITYAVATMGTATTAAHLKRLFQVASEIVFAFDGDRAGRAAAWRALQNVLPEVQEGREIRFLFLPDGHDPDSLIGAEGREAFEKRLADSSTLPQYLISELTGRVNWTDTGGLAKLADLLRPLVGQMPDGAYKTLLIDRLGVYFKKGQEDVAKLLQTSSGRASVRVGPGRTSAGRGSLVQQAVEILLAAPEVAGEVSEAQCANLAALDQAGTEFLCELLANLRATPAHNAAQVLERFREHPYGPHLERLARKEMLISEKGALASQLRGVLDRLVTEQLHRQRFDSLIGGAEKASQEGHTPL